MSTKRTKLKAAVTALAVAASFATRPTAAEGVQLYALQVLPAGPVSMPADGRPALIHDNAALAAAFNAKGRRALLDVGHLSEYTETAAAGWLVEMFVETDGTLWSWVELTAEGRRLIDEKLFGFTSPTVYVRETEAGWEVTRFKSLALTNNPALDTMAANFSAVAEDEADEQDEDASAEQATETAAAAVEASETPAEAPGTTEAEKAAQTPAEAQPATSAAETTALSATPTAPAAPSADLIALTASVTALTAERDAATAQVVALTSQVAALTTERDTAVQALASFKAEQTKAEVERVIAEFTASGQCTVAEHDDLREQAAALGVDKLKSSLSKRPKDAAFSRLSYGNETTAAATPADAAARAYIASLGLDPADYDAGLSLSK